MGDEIESLEFKYEKYRDDQKQIDSTIDLYFQSVDGIPVSVKRIYDFNTRLFDYSDSFKKQIYKFIN
jgi:hypothetical protein